MAAMRVSPLGETRRPAAMTVPRKNPKGKPRTRAKRKPWGVRTLAGYGVNTEVYLNPSEEENDEWEGFGFDD